MADPRAFQEIEFSAANYPPGSYYNLLRFYDTLEVSTDPVSADFIPLAQVRPNPKLFAIGIIPPPIKVPTRVLDRSGTTFSAQAGDLNIEPNQTSNTARESTEKIQAVGNANSHRTAKPILIEAFKEVFGREPSSAELQYLAAIGFLESSYGNGWAGTKDEHGNTPMVGSNNWGAVQCGATVDPSECIKFRDRYPNGQFYNVSFRKYATPKDGAVDLVKHVYVMRGTARGLGPGGSAMDASYIMRRHKYYGGFCRKAISSGKATNQDARVSFRTPDKNEGTKACSREAIEDHAKLVTGIAKGFAAANGDPLAFGLGNYEDAEGFYQNTFGGVQNAAGKQVPGDLPPPDTDWVGGGQVDAYVSWKERTKTDGSKLDLKEALDIAQVAQIKEIQAALDAMKRVPPLRLLVNPQKFGVKGEKIIADGAWGRNGNIVEHWGNGQDVLSASGRVAGFYAIQATAVAGTNKTGTSLTNSGEGPGLTRAARNYSAAWHNFQSLFLLYKNNGGMYLEDWINPDSDRERSNLAMLGSIYIYYDTTLYIGSFNNFTITENDATPHTVEYSFEFNVRAAFLLDRTDDVFTYGAPNLFQRNPNTTFKATNPNAGTRGNPNTDKTVHGPPAARPQTSPSQQAAIDLGLRLGREQAAAEAAKGQGG